MIVNTLFEEHKRKKYTLKMSGDVKKFQINYILVNNRFKNQFKLARLILEIVSVFVGMNF